MHWAIGMWKCSFLMAVGKKDEDVSFRLLQEKISENLEIGAFFTPNPKHTWIEEGSSLQTEVWGLQGSHRERYITPHLPRSVADQV